MYTTILLPRRSKTESARVSMPWLSVRWPRPWRGRAAQQLPVLSGWLSSQLCVPGREGGS